MGTGNIGWDYCIGAAYFNTTLMSFKYISPLSRRNNSIPFYQRTDRKCSQLPI